MSLLRVFACVCVSLSLLVSVRKRAYLSLSASVPFSAPVYVCCRAFCSSPGYTSAVTDTPSLHLSQVTNTGKRSGDYVALCFVAPPAPGVNGAPLKSLRGFDRIFLLPGETKTVSFPVSAYDFAYADANGQFVTSSGDWTVSVDDAAATVTIA